MWANIDSSMELARRAGLKRIRPMAPSALPCRGDAQCLLSISSCSHAAAWRRDSWYKQPATTPPIPSRKKVMVSISPRGLAACASLARSGAPLLARKDSYSLQAQVVKSLLPASARVHVQYVYM